MMSIDLPELQKAELIFSPHETNALQINLSLDSQWTALGCQSIVWQNTKVMCSKGEKSEINPDSLHADTVTNRFFEMGLNGVRGSSKVCYMVYLSQYQFLYCMVISLNLIENIQALGKTRKFAIKWWLW